MEKTAIHRTLKIMNFGLKMIFMINVLHTNFEQCTMNLGYTSHLFKPTRGLFQGNPIASTTSILIVEVLGQNIGDIKSIVIDEVEFKSLQFADDMNLFSMFERQSVDSAKTTLATFGKNTGLRLNYEKTSVYRIGSLGNSQAKFDTTKELNRTNEPINVLGITLDYDQNQMTALNYTGMVPKVQKKTGAWMNRGLSTYGMVIMLNPLIGSLFCL